MTVPTIFAQAEEQAHKIREGLRLGSAPIHDATGLLEDLGIFIVAMPIPGDHLSGAFYYDAERKTAKVLINTSRTAGHQRFTAAHELGHFLFDKEQGFILDDGREKPPYEKRADAFAAHLLMPREGVDLYVRAILKQSKKLEDEDLVRLRHEFGVSWSALIYRLHDLEYAFDKPYQKKVSETKRLNLITQQFGWEPERSKEEGVFKLPADFHRRAFHAYQNKKISLNRLAELLRKSYEETKDLAVKMNQLKQYA